ncbi:MAG TPA: MarR family transcriptional regulator [Caulobacteraceae bacterium]|nr:MarR family transcriptional regulator [Caulobacteraceae bacterium]
MPEPIERFVLHWGEMGAFWGVNRSVAQIHAYLYVQEQPRTAEDIASALGMARSNVSNSIKELLAWGLIRRTPIMGDRRDHFVAETDVWEIASRITAGRKAREVDPAIATLRACVDSGEGEPQISPVVLQRLRNLLEFTVGLDRFYNQIVGLPRSTLMTLMKLGAGIAKLLPAAKQKA